jgi:hypothetical protein
MPRPTIALVPVPPSLRKGLVRRLPQGGKFKDLIGRRFPRTVVLGFAGYKGPFAAWLCQCRCGKLLVREGAYLTYRAFRNGCGCRKKKPLPAYIRNVWNSMRSRCYNRRSTSYKIYGGRGIKVCKRWLNSPEKFAEDMGPRPSPQHILARKNKGGDFAPHNCFWGARDDRTQTRARLIIYKGRTQNLAAWAAEVGITREAMRYRVNVCQKQGLDVSLALTMSAWQRGPKKSAK